MEPLFVDRLDAAHRLSEGLAAYRGRRPLVLAIARGAVRMGSVIANELDGDLDVVLVRKLRAPFCAQLAVGAIDEAGWTYVARHAPVAEADARYLAMEKRFQRVALERLAALYRGARAPLDPAGRTVIVVDDGMATGTTMVAALLAARSRRPAKLVCAVPVAPADTLFELAPCADEFICLEVPERFQTLGRFYRDFARVTDEEAAALFSSRAATSV